LEGLKPKERVIKAREAVEKAPTSCVGQVGISNSAQITLTPSQVVDRFGRMFSRSLLTIVDEKAGVVEIVEECCARGPVEWDLVNRLRAGGAVYAGWVDGTTLTIRANIGKFEVKFGPADLTQGGQALEAVEVRGESVYTKWLGVAGAGVGVAACLPQAPGVLKAIYPSINDLTKVGGRYINRVILETRKFKKLIFAVDDTDMGGKGATWASSLKVALKLCGLYEGVQLLEHRIFQGYPGVPWKTTNNVAVALSFAVPPELDVEVIAKELTRLLGEFCYSNEACAVAYEGIVIPSPLKKYAWKVKSKLVKRSEALDLAQEFGVTVFEISGKRGIVGALAALAFYDSGLECAALKGDQALIRAVKGERCEGSARECEEMG